MGITKAKWRGGQLAFYDGATYETVKPLAPRYLFDDLEGSAIDPLIWAYCLTANPDTQALDGVGHAVFTFTNNGSQQEAGIYNVSNVLSWDTDKGLVVEYRAAFTVLPTEDTEAHLGVIGETWVADKQCASHDDIAEHALFVFDASGDCVIYTDDGTHDNNAIATNVTVTAGATQYHVYRIDFTDIENILFYIDGVRVATTTTFAMNHLASHLVQPYVNMTKHAADTGLGVMYLDYIKIWQATR